MLRRPLFFFAHAMLQRAIVNDKTANEAWQKHTRNARPLMTGGIGRNVWSSACALWRELYKENGENGTQRLWPMTGRSELKENCMTAGHGSAQGPENRRGRNPESEEDGRNGDLLIRRIMFRELLVNLPFMSSAIQDFLSVELAGMQMGRTRRDKDGNRRRHRPAPKLRKEEKEIAQEIHASPNSSGAPKRGRMKVFAAARSKMAACPVLSCQYAAIGRKNHIQPLRRRIMVR